MSYERESIFRSMAMGLLIALALIMSSYLGARHAISEENRKKAPTAHETKQVSVKNVIVVPEYTQQDTESVQEGEIVREEKVQYEPVNEDDQPLMVEVVRAAEEASGARYQPGPEVVVNPGSELMIKNEPIVEAEEEAAAAAPAPSPSPSPKPTQIPWSKFYNKWKTGLPYGETL